MSGCGLDHSTTYRLNTGRYPTIPRLDRARASCEEWERRLAAQRLAPGVTLLGSLKAHDLVKLAWDAHMADLGAVRA